MTDRPGVYVVRHGATEWSVSGRHTGRTDVPLTAEGERQARAAAMLVRDHDFSLVLCSPLGRARETCRLAGLLDQAELTDDLLEWDYGEAEGRTTTEMRETLPGWSVWSSPMAGGETLEDVAARADRIVARCRSLPVGSGDVALFAHGHILRVTIARWCQLDAVEGRRFPLDTAALTILGWEHDYPTIRALNRC